MKAIKFRSPKMAKKIQVYFPKISNLAGAVLYFEEFDIHAFRLAIELEDLNRSDYFFTNGHADETPIWVTTHPWNKETPNKVVEIEIISKFVTLGVGCNDPKYTTNHFCLFVGGNSQSGYSATQVPFFSKTTIPLLIDNALIDFILFLNTISPFLTINMLTTEQISVAYCIVDYIDMHSPRKFTLSFSLDGNLMLKQFYPSELVLDILQTDNTIEKIK